MPRLVGLVPSLDLILTGRKLNARQARKIGLVDEVVPAAYLDRVASERIRAASGAGHPVRRRPLTMQAMEKIGPLRNMVLSRARKKTATKASPKSYPAPFRALDAIEGAFTLPIEQGLDLEARIVGELVPTPTSKNLIWLFKSQSALTRTEAFGVPPRKVRKAAVLGAGVMGGGISQLLANREIAVRLKDLRQDAILSAMQTAGKLWNRQVARRRLSRREAYQKMANIAPTLDNTGLRRVDLVIEAVVEDLEIKRNVLAEMEERLDERAVFASNTSSLPITDIAAKALRPERVVGMHFFNPVHRMPLVEVIAGQKSSPEAVATVHALAARLGKTPVIVRDTPGFLVNRILMVYMNEALQLLGEGVRIDAVDRAMTAFGMPMGPFALLDQVGLDTAYHVSGVLQEAFGDRIGPPSPILGTLVSAGKLGAKNRRGFYRYSGGRSTEPDTDTYNLAATPETREVPAETLEERMLLAMVNEASVCLEHGVVRDPRDVDVSMVMGTGFPPFRGGLLRHADAVGIPIVVDRLSRLADAHGERFRPAGLLNQMVREQRRFYRG
jgi:3-hydroxyacyl-CoA dehydrogenase/enoyl-CoA hydratase/3-hydroxybutyryl-CoA epimerase